MEQKYGKTFDFSFELILRKDNLKLFDVPFDSDTYNIPFIDSINTFLITKEYNVGAIDVIPNIIAKILDHNLLIYKVTSDKSFVSFNV